MSNGTYKRKALKWKNAPAPTGLYRSFHKRSWPSAVDHNGNAAAHLYCEQSYSPRVAKDSGEFDIIVRIADWTNDNNQRCDQTKGAFEWRRLNCTFKNVVDAKAAAEAFVIANAHFLKNVAPK